MNRFMRLFIKKDPLSIDDSPPILGLCHGCNRSNVIIKNKRRILCRDCDSKD